MNVQSFFLTYLLLPVLALISGVILIVVNKKQKLVPSKRLITGILILGLLLALPSGLGFMGMNFMPWGYIISQLADIGLGCALVFLLTIHYPKELIERKLFVTVALLIGMLLGFYLFQLFFNSLSDLAFGAWAGSSIVSFIVPMFFWWAYVALIRVPTEIYKIWQYPAVPVPIEIDHLDFNRMLVLELELYKHTDDPEPIKVKAKAPENMVFGNWFYKFIDDYNLKFPKNPVQYLGDYSETYRWIFFVKTSFFKRNLFIDPDLDILNNGITERVTIYAKRISENEITEQLKGDDSILL